MKSVGHILKSARKKQKKTILQVHQLTRIPEKHLRALEADDFSSLPAPAFARGFLRTYAKNLGLDEEKCVAIFRRSWQDKKKTPLTPEEWVGAKAGSLSFWTPKTAGLLTAAAALTIFVLYIIVQFRTYFATPQLTIEKPATSVAVNEEEIEIKGRISKEASVYINEELIEIDNKGDFSYKLRLFPGENQIEIKAVNRRGRETLVKRTITLVDKED